MRRASPRGSLASSDGERSFPRKNTFPRHIAFSSSVRSSRSASILRRPSSRRSASSSFVLEPRVSIRSLPDSGGRASRVPLLIPCPLDRGLDLESALGPPDLASLDEHLDGVTDLGKHALRIYRRMENRRQVLLGRIYGLRELK